MVLGIDIDFILDSAGQVGAEDGRFVRREGFARFVVADRGVLAEGDADSDDLDIRQSGSSRMLELLPTFWARSAM